jgi:hypothetical protein
MGSVGCNDGITSPSRSRLLPTSVAGRTSPSLPSPASGGGKGGGFGWGVVDPRQRAGWG